MVRVASQIFYFVSLHQWIHIFTYRWFEMLIRLFILPMFFLLSISLFLMCFLSYFQCWNFFFSSLIRYLFFSLIIDTRKWHMIQTETHWLTEKNIANHWNSSVLVFTINNQNSMALGWYPTDIKLFIWYLLKNCRTNSQFSCFYFRA